MLNHKIDGSTSSLLAFYCNWNMLTIIVWKYLKTQNTAFIIKTNGSLVSIKMYTLQCGTQGLRKGQIFFEHVISPIFRCVSNSISVNFLHWQTNWQTLSFVWLCMTLYDYIWLCINMNDRLCNQWAKLAKICKGPAILVEF